MKILSRSSCRSLLVRFTLLCSLLIASVTQAQLRIEITEGSMRPTKIAIPPFGGTLSSGIEEIIQNDLRSSGLFQSMGKSDLLAPYPAKESEIIYRDLRAVGADYILIADGVSSDVGQTVNWSLFDVASQRKVKGQQLSGALSQTRDMAHQISDAVYEAITGIRGAFRTRLVFVRDVGPSVRKRYQLVMTDADGERPRTLFSSADPLLSPTWSNDGRKIAYVSFETSRPAIFVHEISNGLRQQVTNYKGLNGAPAFSPDDRRLALVLSKDGNPEIYIMDLASRNLTRLTKTRDAIIDTEPAWSADGKFIYFTSNRGGNPQIYRISSTGGKAERVTFAGDYNARPKLSADGRTMVMVNRTNDNFHIAWQDLETGDTRILTKTDLDESPTIAPNSAMVLYATKKSGRDVLAAVSMDAGARFFLPSNNGAVREPAWSPFPAE